MTTINHTSRKKEARIAKSLGTTRPGIIALLKASNHKRVGGMVVVPLKGKGLLNFDGTITAAGKSLIQAARRMGFGIGLVAAAFLLAIAPPASATTDDEAADADVILMACEAAYPEGPARTRCLEALDRYESLVACEVKL